MICIFSWESSFTGHLRIALVFLILTIALVILESPLGNTPVTYGNFPKASGAPFHHKLAEHIFWGVYV